ncbi:MAG: ComF family protein [Acidimicrobiales bacterium]
MLLLRVCPGCRGAGSERRRGRWNGGACDRCLSRASAAGAVEPVVALDSVEALFLYDDVVRRIVLSAKNRGRRDVLQQLGLLLAERAAAMASGVVDPSTASFDLVTWVPASRAGKRRRGFDQGAVLSRVVADRLGVKSRRLLLRRRGEAQAGRGRVDRIGGPQVRARLRCPPRVLLIDDVITTGASMSVSAQALRRAGAHSVHGLAVSWAAPAYQPSVHRAS